MSTFVLINAEGKFAVAVCNRGGWSQDTSANEVRETDNLNVADVFDERDKKKEPYKYAKTEGYIEVPAYSIRVVKLGVEP